MKAAKKRVFREKLFFKTLDEVAKRFYTRFARLPKDLRVEASAAADEMLAFQEAQIGAGAGRDVDLKAAIEEGRMWGLFLKNRKWMRFC